MDLDRDVFDFVRKFFEIMELKSIGKKMIGISWDGKPFRQKWTTSMYERAKNKIK